MGTQITETVDTDGEDIDIDIDPTVDEGADEVEFEIELEDTGLGDEETADLEFALDEDNEETLSVGDTDDVDDTTLTLDDIGNGDEFTIDISPDEGDETGFEDSYEGEISFISGLETGSSATVALVDQSGAQYTYGISVPSTFGDATVVEV
nr:hypothetical protein [Natronococcus amylolyticus]